MNTPLVLMILDKSGSMSCVRNSMQKSIDQIIRDQSTERGNADVCIYTFSSECSKPVPITSFASVPSIQINTGGCTALYDAIIKAINSIPSKYKDVLVLIQTDGQDNKSKHHPTEAKNLIQSKINQGWNFLYMGAEIDVSYEAGKIGLKDYAVKFKRNSKGIEQVFNEMSRKISNFRASLDTNILKPK